MSKKDIAEAIVEVRANINTEFVKFEALRIEREKREQAERDAEREREWNERRKASEEWEKTHRNLYKYTYASYYNKDTFNYDYGAVCEVYFYEWSDINSEPRKFERMHRLYQFLDACDIFLESEQNNKVGVTKPCFISCKPGVKDLIIVSSYDELKREMKQAENLAAVLAPVPEIDDAS